MAEKIQFEVFLENGQFKTKLKDTEKGIDNLGKSTERANARFSKIGLLAKTGVGLAVAAVGKLIVEGVKLATQFEKTSVAFATMLGGGKGGRQAADKLLKDIQQFASQTPLSFDDLVTGSKRLMAFGTEVNDVIPTMQMLGDAAQGNAATLDRLTLAYGKIQTRGRTSLEELNQISEAGVPILDTLAENYGVTKDELFKMVSAGKVGFKDVKNALADLTGEGGKFHGMMAKMSSTLAGKWSTFTDNIKLTALEIGQKLIPSLSQLLGAYSNATKSGGIFSKMLTAAVWVISKVVTSIALLVNALSLISSKTGGWFDEQIVKRNKAELERLKTIRATLKDQEKIARLDKTIATVQGRIDKYTASSKNNQEESKNLTEAIKNNAASLFGFEDKNKKLIEEQNKILKDQANLTKKRTPSGGGSGRTGKPKDTSKPDKSLAAQKGFTMDFYSGQDPVALAGDHVGAISSALSEASSLWDEYYSQQEARVDSNLEKKMTAIETWYLAEKDSLLNSQMDQEARDLALAQLETEKEKREQAATQKAQKEKAKIQRDNFKKQRALGIANVWIAAAQGVMQGFAQLGPIGGAIMAAVTLAMAGAQTALIASQKPPAMATGTTNVPADMLANIHKGEGVIPKTFMDGVRSGELTLGKGANTGTTYNVTVEGSIQTETEFFDRMDQLRNERSQNLGMSNYGGIG